MQFLVEVSFTNGAEVSIKASGALHNSFDFSVTLSALLIDRMNTLTIY